LKEIINKNIVYIFCIQETMKSGFIITELKKLVGGQSFAWNWIASQGNSRGTLIGVRHGDLDAEDMDEGKKFSSVKIRNRSDNLCWKVINVYGPVKHELKGQFL
jgi:hypothetical protein